MDESVHSEMCATPVSTMKAAISFPCTLCGRMRPELFCRGTPATPDRPSAGVPCHNDIPGLIRAAEVHGKEIAAFIDRTGWHTFRSGTDSSIVSEGRRISRA